MSKPGPPSSSYLLPPSFSSHPPPRVYVGLDKRVIAAGAPKWLALRGFERCPAADVGPSDVTPADLAPQGFGLYSRFCRGLSIVPLGKNVDSDGDSVEGKHGGGAAAMYFVVVVRVPEAEAVAEVDIGPVAMHRSVGKIVSETKGPGGREGGGERALLAAWRELYAVRF